MTTMQKVAVRLIRTRDFIDVTREAKFYYRLEHPNIIHMLGLAFQGRYTMMVMELMDLGNLKDYMESSWPPPCPGYNSARGNRTLHLRDLLEICHQVASGLAYIASQSIVHRDLSARNCLVTSTDSHSCPSTVKIGDFGLSRNLYASYYYTSSGKHDTPVLIAPECIQSLKYSLKSDIWAFGITMWEVFSYGNRPFDSLPNEIVQQRIQEGHIPEQTEHCPDELYSFMQKCWSIEPSARPTAAESEAYIQSRLA